MQIDYRYHSLYKRLAKRFSLATIERHWDKLKKAVECRAFEDMLKHGGTYVSKDAIETLRKPLRF